MDRIEELERELEAMEERGVIPRAVGTHRGPPPSEAQDNAAEGEEEGGLETIGRLMGASGEAIAVDGNGSLQVGVDHYRWVPIQGIFTSSISAGFPDGAPENPTLNQTYEDSVGDDANPNPPPETLDDIIDDINNREPERMIPGQTPPITSREELLDQENKRLIREIKRLRNLMETVGRQLLSQQAP